jgi:hypothetical protein
MASSETPSVSVMDLCLSTFCHTLRVRSERLLDRWEAVPLAAPLSAAEETNRIKRPWAPVRVPEHWQLEDAFAAYEGLVLYRCRFEVQASFEGEMLSLRAGRRVPPGLGSPGARGRSLGRRSPAPHGPRGGEPALAEHHRAARYPLGVVRMADL